MPTVTVVVTAASPARHLTSLVNGLDGRGWTPTIFATRSATEAFAEDWPAGLVTATMPLGQPGALLVAPATFHTVAAIAAGLNNTDALQIIHHAIGTLPVYLWAHVDCHLSTNPILARNLRTLADLGITILDTGVCDGGCPADAHWPHVVAQFAMQAKTMPVVTTGGHRVG